MHGHHGTEFPGDCSYVKPVEPCSRPCATCAFRADAPVLGTANALQVLAAVDAGPFFCHESLEEGRWVDALVGDRTRLCAGAEAVRGDLTGRLRANFLTQHEGASAPGFRTLTVEASPKHAARV